MGPVLSGCSNTTGIAEDARIERVRQMSLTPEQFALETGACEGFHPAPANARAWMIFWKEDICEKEEFHTWFPAMSLVDAQRFWLAMEDQFFARYERFVRIWPEWGSSGIWAPPYPGSRRSGGMIDYASVHLPFDLIARCKAWQDGFDDHEPGAPEKFDWDRHAQTGDLLALDFKAALGPRIYVEHRDLAVRGATRLLACPEERNRFTMDLCPWASEGRTRSRSRSGSKRLVWRLPSATLSMSV